MQLLVCPHHPFMGILRINNAYNNMIKSSYKRKKITTNSLFHTISWHINNSAINLRDIQMQRPIVISSSARHFINGLQWARGRRSYNIRQFFDHCWVSISLIFNKILMFFCFFTERSCKLCPPSDAIP